MIITMQLTTMVSRMSKSKNWLHTICIHSFLKGFHGWNMNSDFDAVNRNIVNLLNFFAMATNDCK